MSNAELKAVCPECGLIEGCHVYGCTQDERNASPPSADAPRRQPTAITAVIFPDAEAWLLAELPDMEADGVSAVYRSGQFHADGMEFRDSSEGTVKILKLADFVKALQLLSEQIGKTLFVGGLQGGTELTDPGNWDAEVVDAFFQLAYHGEVIYG